MSIYSGFEILRFNLILGLPRWFADIGLRLQRYYLDSFAFNNDSWNNLTLLRMYMEGGILCHPYPEPLRRTRRFNVGLFTFGYTFVLAKGVSCHIWSAFCDHWVNAIALWHFRDSLACVHFWFVLIDLHYPSILTVSLSKFDHALYADCTQAAYPSRIMFRFDMSVSDLLIC